MHGLQGPSRDQVKDQVNKKTSFIFFKIDLNQMYWLFRLNIRWLG